MGLLSNNLGPITRYDRSLSGTTARYHGIPPYYGNPMHPKPLLKCNSAPRTAPRRKRRRKMKPRSLLSLALALVLLLTAGLAQAQQVFQFTTHDIKLEILPPQVFEARFGDNPDVPRTEKAILAMAEQLYGRKGPTQDAKGEECGEYEVGLLFAALQNPEVSDHTRRQVDYIMAAALPTASWKTYTSGYFKFFYVDNDPYANHNVTLAEVQATATAMNYGWNKYVNAGFQVPKHYLTPTGAKRIDVKIYYISSTTLGQTDSTWNHIELNSKSCVKDSCKRKTTSNHELFHRVQYTSGYVTGTANMKWIVEGSASWSQKFTYASIRDYMDRMNSGLQYPDKNLITTRSYDNCHFWVYMDELFNPAESGAALKEVWNKYSTNGKNAKAAVAWVASTYLGLPTFDNYVIKWTRANYCKDFTNASATWKHDYTEDETTTTQCSVTHGPLSHAPKVAAGTISSNSTVITKSGAVAPYGADNYEFTVGAAVTTVKIFCDGADTGDFAWQFIPIKASQVKTYSYTTTREYTHTRSFAAGAYDKYGVIVMGRSKGGSYTLRVGP